MKKSIIAAGAASVALAAMPIVGAFAANTTYTGLTDKVLLEVTKSCQMEADDSLDVTVSPNKGTEVDLGEIAAGTAVAGSVANDGTEMIITCNSTAGWTLSAQATDMTTNVSGGPNYTIPFGQYAGASQTTSVWSAQIAMTGQGTSPARAQISNGAGAYSTTTVNTTGTTVIAQNTSDSSVSPAKPYGVSGLTITPSYTAYAAADQEAGNYAGTITYTFADLTPAP